MNVLLQWGGHPVVHRLGWTLLHFLWQGAVVAGLFAVAQIWLPRRSSNARYWAGCLTLLLMLAAPVITFLILGAARTVPAAFAAGGTGYSAADRAALAEPARMLAPDGQHGQRGQNGQPRAAEGSRAEPSIIGGGHRPPLQAAPAVPHSEKLIPGFVFAWLLGVSGLSLRLLFSSLQVARWKRRGNEPLGAPWLEQLHRLKVALQISRPVRMVKSVLVEVPTVVGWLRPIILLPAASLTGLTPGQLESILAHELAHIRRHDYLVNLLQNALETLLFYHPAVWWVSSCVRAEREICCDEIAVRLCGDRLVYAQALTTLEELRGGGTSLALGAGGGSLLERIRRLSGAPSGGSFPSRRSAGGALVAALVAIILISLLHHPSSKEKAQADAAANSNLVVEIDSWGNPDIEPDRGRSTNLVAVGEWSKPVDDGGGHRLRTRLSVYEGTYSTNQFHQECWFEPPVYLEIQDVSPATMGGVEVLFDVAKGLRFELRNAKGGPAVNLEGGGGFSGGRPGATHGSVPPGGILRIRVNSNLAGIRSWLGAPDPKPGLRLSFFSHPGWFLPVGDTNAYFLSATLAKPPTDSTLTNSNAWLAHLDFPAVKLTAKPIVPSPTGRPVIGKLLLPAAVTNDRTAVGWVLLEAADRQIRDRMARDGSFRLDNVPAGKWGLEAEVLRNGEQMICVAERTFEIPEMPGGRADEPLDLGMLEPVMAHAPQIGDPVPLFEVKTTDGAIFKLADHRGQYVLLDFEPLGGVPKIEALRAAWEAFGTNDRLAVLTLVVQPTGPYDFHAWREDFPWPQTQLRDLPRYVAYSLRSSLGLPMDQMMASPLPDLPGAMLLGPDGKIVATDLHGDAIKAAVAKALSAKPDSIAPSGTNQTNAASDPANSSRPAQEVAWGEVTQGLQVGLSCTDLETTSDRQPRFDVHLRNRLDRPLAIPSEDAFISLLRADWPEFRSRPLAPQITPLGEGRTTYFITGGVEMRDARATRRVLGPGETVVVSNLQLSAGTFVPGQDSYGTKTSEQTYLLLPGGEYRVAYVFESAQTNIEGEPVWNGKAASGELTVTVRPPVPAEGLEGSFQLAKSNFFVGELIYATLNLRSTSAKPVSFANGGDYFNGRDARYSFTAADEAGRPVPDPLLNHPGVGGGPGGARTLKRGETFSDQVLVNLYLNFTNAGHYTLICHRTLSLVEPGQLEGIAPQFPVESKFSVNLVRDDQAHAREVEQVFAGYDASQDEMIGAWATARDEAAFPEIEKRAKAPGRYQSNFISWVAEYGEQGVPALLVAARSSEPSCRSLALSLLSGMKAKEAPELVKASLGSTDARERAEAVLQCSKQRVPGTLESLLAMGKDPDPLVRRYLGAALGAWGDERAVPVLLDLLHDANPDPFIRIWAAGGLSALGHKREPVPVMIDLLRTMKPSDGAGNVMLCLKDLTGQDLGQNPARWIEWWEKEGTTYKGGANPSGITLEIRCETNVFKVGDEIPIQFIISNHGTADYKYLNITPDHGGGLLEFRLVANTASGENVPDPRMHSDQVFAGGVSSPAVLHPGESFTKIIPLNRWALIKEAGRYDVVGNYLQQPLGNPIVLASSAPIRITVSPRTKEEMDDYVKGLTNQIAARLPFQAGGNGGQYDFVLEDSMRKLAYSCSPGGVPTLLTVINEYSEYCPQAVWGQEALLYYVPHTEETRKSILQSAARNGLNDLMEHILQHYELNHAEWKPIIDAALGPRNPGEWYFGATLAADSCYDDAFTSRLIAIALDSNAPARVGNVVLEGPPRNNTRAAAIEALARNRTDEGVRALKTLLNDPNREIWEPLAEAIQDGYSTRANTPPPNDPAPEVFVPLGVGFPDAHRGRINSPTGRRLQPGDIEAKDVIPLIERLLAYQGPYLPLDGVNFAAWFGDDALTPTLVSLATTPGSGYRGNAIWGLALNRTDEGVKTLKTLLNDPDPKTSKLVEQIIRNAYLSRGDARGRPLRPDDFDAKYQQPEANPSGIMLEIRCTNEVLKVGDEIPIEFIISNHGTKDYRYGDTVFGPNISRQPFELHAKTDSGQKLLNAATLNYPAIAAQGHSIIPAIPVEFAESGVLHPGGSFTKINPLNVWALVKDPGHYEVEGAFFNFYDFPNWAPVAAAPIRITVLPRTEEDMHNYIADLTNRVAERLAGRKGKPATSTDWAMVGLLSKLAYTCSPEIVPCLFQTISDDSADHTEGYWMHEALGYYVPHTEEIRKAVVEAGSKDYLYEHMKDFLGWVLADYGVQSEEVKPLEKPAQPASTNANTGETPAAAPNRARDFADLVTVQQAVGMPSGLSLEIRCTNTVLKVGDEIPIEFIVSNHRTNDYEYEDRVSNRSGRLDEFRLDATTASGERVPDPRATLTAWMGGGTYGPGVLYPGQSFTKIIALNRWALIKEPGRYEVTGTYLGAEISTNPIAPVTAKPISVTVLPRSKKEMGDYIRGLTNELSLLLATHVPDRYDGPLEETLKKLMYTCSPEIVPTLLATQYDSVEGFWANEALLYYVPRTEETWQAILQAAPSHLSSGNMQYTLWNYGGNGELLRPLIAWALAAENPAVWQAGAQLAAGNYYDDAFTARLIAIASDASASKYSRDEAFEALARNRTDAGVKTLKTLLDDPNPDIWVPLSQAILNGLSSECKSPTGKHLQPADFGTKDMKPLIQRLLATSEPMVRSLGMSLAQHFGDDAFTPKLVEAAMSYGPERTGATYALAMNRTDDGVRTLKTLLHDYDPETVQMAEDAIRCAYTWRGDARGRPLRPDDFDAKYQQPEAGLSP